MDFLKLKINAVALALGLLVANIAVGQTVPGSPTLWERAAYGNIPGVQRVVLAGYNGAITTTAETIWFPSSDYTFLTSNASSPTISSSSASDASAGTGARTVRVSCVDANYAATSADYTLNGQTGVALTQDCMGVNNIQILTAGSAQNNIGSLYVGTGTVTSGVPAVVHGVMIASDGRAQQATYNVPAGHALICRNLSVTSADATAARFVEVRIEHTDSDGIKRIERVGGVGVPSGVSVSPLTHFFGEQARVELVAFSSASTGPIMASAECLLLNDSWISGGQLLF